MFVDFLCEIQANGDEQQMKAEATKKPQVKGFNYV